MNIFNQLKPTLTFICIAGMLLACNPSGSTTEDVAAAPVTPVTVTHPDSSAISNFIELNATATYLQRSYVKANINGYIQSMKVRTGQQIAAGTVLFRLITKEATAIGNAVNQLDPALKFSGISNIRATQSGFITNISHQQGDYVQDGEALAEINNKNSLVFLLNLPYEYHNKIRPQSKLELTLTDGEKLQGTLGASLPAVDSAAQTEQMIIRVNPTQPIPEGLIAKVKLILSSKPKAQSLPKSAVLSNETEDEFWVMKLLNDSTAIKVPVKTGIINNNSIEITSPVFNLKDRIIVTGNYGIADTAKVKVIK